MLRLSRQKPRTTGITQSDKAKGGPPDVAGNLRRLRQERGYSLEALARLSGVSRAMLGQIETGKSAPTVTLLWKVATALGVTLPDLIASQTISNTFVIRRSRLRGSVLSDGKAEVFSYVVPGRPLQFEATLLRLAPAHTEVLPPIGPRALALLIVNKGPVSIAIDGITAEVLESDEAILFDAGLQHAFSNVGEDDAVLYLVTSFDRHGWTP